MRQLRRLPNQIAYLAPLGLEDLFAERLAGKPHLRQERLFWGAIEDSLLNRFASNIWRELYEIEFDSISDCAKALTSLQRSWWPYMPAGSSRASYIQKALPHVGAKPVVFSGKPTVYPPLGSWRLLDDHRVLASPSCSSPRPNGEWIFAEDRAGPPNRAYLKLWEAFTRIGVAPQKGEICLDLGASPGGWTWVLHQMGAHVKAFDRSPLRADLMQAAGVEFIEADAFRVDLSAYPEASWLFCDVICYPEKLYEWVSTCVVPSSIQYAVCTLKFQGREHYGVIDSFAQIPNGWLGHLSQNKHELTWVWSRLPRGGSPTAEAAWG